MEYRWYHMAIGACAVVAFTAVGAAAAAGPRSIEGNGLGSYLTHKISVSLTMPATDATADCVSGTGGYTDIKFGQTITLKSGGTTIGAAGPSTGAVDTDDSSMCVWVAEFPDVPDRYSSYTASTSGRGSITDSRSEVAGSSPDGWLIGLTLDQGD